jgi:hypothetical protein
MQKQLDEVTGDAERWRRLEIEALTLAAGMTDPEPRRVMHSIADAKSTEGVFAWCGDALSWVRQHRSRNIPAHWRQCADQARRAADQETDPTTTATLLEIAEACEKLAALAEAKPTLTLPE